MSVEHGCNDTDGEKNEVLGEKPVPFSLYRPKLSRGLAQARTRATEARGRRLIKKVLLLFCPVLPYIRKGFV